jgi:hypothetical protein
MIKIIAPGSQSFDVPTMEMVKVSNSGLRGDDLRSFVKRAGHEFADKLRDVHVAPGEQLVHLIAIGSTEAYGPNRNGDGFKSATCRKHHPTFVKHARWYRNHQNKDEAKSYGIIKLSAFNEAMKRIELLVALNATKEAADRNKGLVADKEIQKIASGSNDWGVSMACRVPFDVCSGCGNKAPSRAQYCKEASCKYGGCYDNLTKVSADGHILHVDNPDPTWFDISDVYRPADRIAYVFGHMKAASAGQNVGGAHLADELGITAPYRLNFDTADDRSMELIKLAYQLADLETALESGSFGTSVRDAVILNDKTASVSDIPAGRLTGLQIWRALSREKIALSVKDWLDVVAVNSESPLLKSASVADISARLPGVFSRLISDNLSLEHCIGERACDPSMSFPGERVKDWANKLASDKSINPYHFERRITHQIISGNTKTASFKQRPSDLIKTANSDESEQLARRYATYQLYFLNELKADQNYSWYQEHAVRANYLCPQ